MRRLAAGNWKMHGTGADLAEVDTLIAAHPDPGCELLICPPATLIHRMAERARGTALVVGAQDCHPAHSGAHTGEVSASMLKEAGARYVIVGHSERRADHGESDAIVRDKAAAAAREGLAPIVCVGETLAQREAGKTLDVVAGQLDGSVPDDLGDLVVAYEPVWAIGSGLTPTTAQIAEVHAAIRDWLGGRDAVRILYGGSVKPGNAAEIFAVENVDGALVGGASLKAADFGAIVAALSEAG